MFHRLKMVSVIRGSGIDAQPWSQELVIPVTSRSGKSEVTRRSGIFGERRRAGRVHQTNCAPRRYSETGQETIGNPLASATCELGVTGRRHPRQASSGELHLRPTNPRSFPTGDRQNP
jgi:hypothetical protein